MIVVFDKSYKLKANSLFTKTTFSNKKAVNNLIFYPVKGHLKV